MSGHGPETEDRATWSAGFADGARVLRRHRVLILAVTLAAVALALTASLVQAPKYRAQASVSFTDESRDLSVLGAVAVRSQEPDQLAAANATTLTRPALLLDVKRRLHLPLSVSELSKRYTARVEPTSNLVAITATADKAAAAARLADALAAEAVLSARGDARARYRKAARGVADRLRGLRGPENAATRSGLEQELTRLESLAVLASPANIAESAGVPKTPASPKPVRNTVLGGFLGLLLGVFAAYGRNAFDRRLRDPDEIAQQVAMPVVGHVRDDNLGHLAGADGTNGGGHEIEAFSILHSNLLFLAEAVPRTVLVTSGLPQEGKTTVASSLASASAAAGKRTLLVECDVRRPALAERLKLNRSPGLSDHLTAGAAPAEVLQQVAVVPGRSANGDEPAAPGTTFACVVAGSPTARPVEMLSSPRFKAFLEQVRSAYDLVILDTSPLLPIADTRELVSQVDAVLFCVRAEQTTRDQALAGKDALTRLPRRPTGLVITGLSPREAIRYGYYGYEGYGS